MRFNAAFAFVALQPVYAAKIASFRRSDPGTHGTLVVCTAPNTPDYKVVDPQKACNTAPAAGDKWSWRVNKASPYDIKLELKSLKHEMHFKIEVISAVDQSGTNSPEQMGRQATSWVAEAVLGTKTHRAWLKTAMNLNGHFSKAVTGNLTMDLPKIAEDFFDEVCVQPITTQGYEVTETSMKKNKFSVGAKCAKDYTGYAQVTECAEEQLAYLLSGCRPEMCTQPENTLGYDLSVLDLSLASFDVDVTCMSGYIGAPTVAKYKTGYDLVENSLQLNVAAFSVNASCANGYYGVAKAIICKSADEPYTLSGCHKIETCQEPQALGYELTLGSKSPCADRSDGSRNLHDWSLTAHCAMHFHGNAKVQKCTKDAEEFQISGCEPDACSAPADKTGTTTTVAECTTPALNDRKGYVVRSVSTYIFNFEVAVKCDENYLGTARVQRCQKHGEPYKLSGCRVKMCTAPFDTTGYSVKEDSLAMHSFWVTARTGGILISFKIVGLFGTNLFVFVALNIT
eukprot:g22543.t1